MEELTYLPAPHNSLDRKPHCTTDMSPTCASTKLVLLLHTMPNDECFSVSRQQVENAHTRGLGLHACLGDFTICTWRCLEFYVSTHDVTRLCGQETTSHWEMNVVPSGMGDHCFTTANCETDRCVDTNTTLRQLRVCTRLAGSAFDMTR